MQALWAEQGHHAVSVSDVASELYDLTRTRGRITLRDLVESGAGATVVGLLCSVDVFGAYDTREEEHAAKAVMAAGMAAAPPLAVQ